MDKLYDVIILGSGPAGLTAGLYAGRGGLNALIIEKGQNAFFMPSTDEVLLPERRFFSDAASFYATDLHEIVHWSDGKSRLNREMKGRFSSENYAFEELIAELGSVFLMADLGIVG